MSRPYRGNVEYITDLTYEHFLDNISHHNLPLLIGPSLTSQWPATHDWRLSNSSPSYLPDLALLRTRYAHHTVSVANTTLRSFNEFERSERKLGDVLDEWESGKGEGLYVKDWHLVLEVEKEGGKQEEVYETPDIFKDDWLTSYYLSLPPPLQSDYRFTYLGPSQTFTPLHRDVYASYSWSTNILGRKRWWLIPPEVWDRERNRLEGCFGLRELQREVEGVWVVDQEPGETIFIPSGWYHQVLNLDFCISINQNFFNSITLPSIYAALLISLEKVEDSIEDVKGMIQQRCGDAIYIDDQAAGGSPNDDEDNDNNDMSSHGRSLTIGTPSPADMGHPPILQWEVEWAKQVESLLEMDAGWGLRVFWDMIRYNLKHPPAPPHLRPPFSTTHAFILPLIADFQTRKEWISLRRVREIIIEIEKLLGGVP